MIQQPVAEVIQRFIAHELRDMAHARFILGQCLGLLIVDHLQPMLELAQEFVGFR